MQNLPANARDMGSIPDWGAGEGLPHAVEQLSLCCRAWEPQLASPHAPTAEASALEPMLHVKRSPCNEKPTDRS